MTVEERRFPKLMLLFKTIPELYILKGGGEQRRRFYLSSGCTDSAFSNIYIYENLRPFLIMVNKNITYIYLI